MNAKQVITPDNTNPSYRYYYNIILIPIISVGLLGYGVEALVFVFGLAFVLHALADTLLVKYKWEKKIFIPRDNPKFKSYQLPMILCVPVQLIVTICAIIYPYTSIGQMLAAGGMIGIAGGIIGLSSGHELIHRETKFKRGLGITILYCINYPYFAIEHMWHHLHLATELDTDVAKRGESVYRFFLRSIPAGWMTCWKWEGDKLKRKGQSALSWNNRMLRITTFQVLIFALIAYFFGINSLIVFALSGLVSICILKWADYIEHYGIVRKMINGKAEAITREHSWDSVNSLTSYAVLNLSHHGHHHQIASVPYYKLEASPTNPNTLAHGYTTLMLLSLFPKQWDRYMQPYLERNGYASYGA